MLLLASSAFLLVVASAIPGLAASTEKMPTFPSQEQVTEAIAEEEAAEAREEEWLSSPDAVREREAAEYAYTDISAPEEEELLRASFPTQLERLESDPARRLSRVQLDRVFSQDEALVTVEGKKMLLESSIPVRAARGEGQLRKVDLGLEETDRGYAPANPIVGLSLPDTAAGRVYVGDSGLAIAAEDAGAEAAARPFGDDDLFIPGVHTDSSLLLSPVAGGVDVSTLLLSRESPEQLGFAVTLPRGATLKASDNGGAEVLAEDGSLIASVNPPRALDAQGAEVPVTMAVEKQSLVIDIPHRSLDIAYPVLVDPEVVENWSGWTDPNALNYWNWQWNTAGEKDYLGKRSCIVTCWGEGLYVRSKSEFTYPEGSYGRWWFVPQGSTTYMSRVVLGPMNFDAHGCTANQPHGYTGIWNEGGWWSVLATAYPSGWITSVDTSGLGEGDRVAFVAMGAANNTNIKCGRDYALGGTTLYLDDPESPTIDSVTGLPSGWVKGNVEIVAKVTASDPGLGVQKIRALGGPAGEWSWDQSECAGTMEDLCAGTRTGQITIKTNELWEGKKTVSFQPFDPTGKGANSKSYEVWVDRVPPTIDLEGQLAKATEEEGEEEVPAGEGDQLSLPTYNLNVTASDATSGAKSIEIFLDGSKTPETTEPPECVAGKCTLTYPLHVIDLSAGKHVLHVVATDEAENVQERKVEFEYAPATGLKDGYAMHYIPLPDGLDHSEEAESHGPEIAVNVVNGNVVYHERDIQVEGRDANLELERSYNSQLPAERDTRWGHGWSVAQLPEFESKPSESQPTEATMLRTSGAMTSAVSVPTSTSESTFDPELHATIDKTEGGGYEVSYEDKEEENVFDSSGELETTNYPSGAALNVDRKGAYKYVTPSYQSYFGNQGEGDGQVDAPGDLAFDSKNNLWLLDQGNNRVEEFSPSGEFLTAFGGFGSGDGQLHMPSAIAIDASDNLWIADTENSRIEEFDSEGNYVSQFGSEGSAEGQLGRPEGIAIDSEGNLWVADTYNSRIQKFSDSGTFIESFGSYGTGKGQFYNPTGIDFGVDDTLWVADWSNNRVTELNTSGEVLREFGSAGSGVGQFQHPDAVEADGEGRVWIGDEGNDRVQAFSESTGAYITQFGAQGAAPGQFDFHFPMGIASDGKGDLRISDGNNNRIQWWKVGEFEQGEEVTGLTVEESDPWPDTNIEAEFETGEGLVEAVDVEGGPESDYSYESDLLTAAQDEEGETSYGYDSSERLSSIELPNGTTATIEYDELSRATSVTVDPAGEEGPETTTFEYVNEPRETIVSGGGSPEVVYLIGNDGSVFQWSYVNEPPKFVDLGGTLWEHRNSTTPLEAGEQSLTATADSAQQIAEVQVLINGEVAVEETTCEDDPETSEHECQQVPILWGTDTGSHPAGQLNLEVVATDFLGQSVSEKFFVTIPQQPEVEPEEPEEPTFEDVKDFREEFGLDYESGRSQSEINELIFELLEEWQLQKPLALWASKEWGVPLREAEIKEIQYREAYIDHDSSAIEEWTESHVPAEYAGYYVNHAIGGIIFVGFTSDQAKRLSELKAQSNLMAPDRLSTFPTPPTNSLQSLEALAESIEDESSSNEVLTNDLTSLGVDEASNLVEAGATDVETVETELHSLYGATAPIYTTQETSAIDSPPPVFPGASRGRDHDHGRIFAGDRIFGHRSGAYTECTAGFGAWENRKMKSNGQLIRARFLLTAGHCSDLGSFVRRSSHANLENSKKWVTIGSVNRTGLPYGGQHYETDALGVRLEGAGLAPHEIQTEGLPLHIKQAVAPRHGQLLCVSGAHSDRVDCGRMTGVRHIKVDEFPGRVLLIVVHGLHTESGDSGSPLWNAHSGRAVGLLQGRSLNPNHANVRFFTPLVKPRGFPAEKVPGALHAPGMGNLHLIVSP